MSNRTLLEFNHDFWDRVDNDPNGLAAALTEMMRSGGIDDGGQTVLGHYGVKWHGQRHHSEPFKIEWGHHKAEG